MSYYFNQWPPCSLNMDFSFGPKKILVYMGPPKKVFENIVKCLNVIPFDDKILNHVASANNIMLDIL